MYIYTTQHTHTRNNLIIITSIKHVHKYMLLVVVTPQMLPISKFLSIILALLQETLLEYASIYVRVIARIGKKRKGRDEDTVAEM